MSPTNRNFVLAYAFMVILPLVALGAILQSGHRLTAPVSIDGAWTFQADSPQLDSLPCGKLFATIADNGFLISQSGKSFVLSFPGGPKVAASGTLEGTTLRATLTPPKSFSGSNCKGANEFSMVASVERSQDARRLVGALSAKDCPACASVAFHAEVQNARQKEDR